MNGERRADPCGLTDLLDVLAFDLVEKKEGDAVVLPLIEHVHGRNDALPARHALVLFQYYLHSAFPFIHHSMGSSWTP
jgi:hypothetical protein